jgi:hypothetical protein
MVWDIGVFRLKVWRSAALWRLAQSLSMLVARWPAAGRDHALSQNRTAAKLEMNRLHTSR